MGYGLVVNTRGFDLGRIRSAAGSHSIYHPALGARGLEGHHGKCVVAVAAGDFQGHGHGLAGKTHHAHLVDHHFSVGRGPCASVMHRVLPIVGVGLGFRTNMS